jgi:hypothetical protein
MSTFSLAFIVPITVKDQPVRKLIFESEDGKTRGSLLAGPWKKATLVAHGKLDGAPITTPYALPLVLRNSKHGQILRPRGVRILLVDPKVEAALDDSGAALVGKDGKSLFNLTGGSVEIVTFTLFSGDDDAAFGAPVAPTATDDEAFA